MQSTKWPSEILAVAFDMDGLLLNTEQLYVEVFQTLLQRRGQRFTDELQRGMMGLPGPQALALLISVLGLVDTATELQAESDEIFSTLLPHRLCTLPGLEELISILDEEQIPRCVATSSRRWFATQLLSTAGVLHRFDFIITAEDVAHGKPAPDIYLAAARRMQVDPAQMLVLEDSERGCQAGVAAGACTIAVPGDHSCHHDFSGTMAVADALNDGRILSLFGKAF